MKSLQDQIVAWLAQPINAPQWFRKGQVTDDIDWFYIEKGEKKKALADTVSRELRSAEENKRVARRDNGKSCEYRFLPPEHRERYIPFSMRENKDILFRADLSQDIPNQTEEPKKRTLKQNDSLHLFCNNLAGELNGKGMYMQLVLKPDYELKWDTKSVKENLYKPIAKALYGVESTTELDTDQISKVHHQLMIMLVEKFPQVDYVDFPSVETTENYINSIKEI